MEKRVISCEFVDNDELYAAYMPFLANGGLFIILKEYFSIGEEVILELKLMSEPESQEVHGVVAWLTPEGAQGGKPAGIGVQFVDENSGKVRTKIETYLAGMLHSSKQTFTL